jgi:hypothetical protein
VFASASFSPTFTRQHFYSITIVPNNRSYDSTRPNVIIKNGSAFFKAASYLVSTVCHAEMRLLQLESNGEFCLTENLFDDGKIPQYAIFSHSWGPENEEVVFEDLTNCNGNENAGYCTVALGRVMLYCY